MQGNRTVAYPDELKCMKTLLVCGLTLKTKDVGVLKSVIHCCCVLPFSLFPFSRDKGDALTFLVFVRSKVQTQNIQCTVIRKAENPHV